MTQSLPNLLAGASTRESLHRYSKVAGAIRRSLTSAHPLWWNISLTVYSEGLTTGSIEVPSRTGDHLEIQLNLRSHHLEIAFADESRKVDLTIGLTGSELGDRTVELMAALGIETEVDRNLYADDDATHYATTAAEEYLSTILWVEHCLTQTAQRLDGDTGPIQLWPHHFDLSFEWYGTRIVKPEEGVESEGARAQIGFGFSLGDSSVGEPYFYATPWPFDAQVVAQALPEGATWYQGGWQGALLRYKTVAADRGTLLADFIETVHAIASPGLTT
jgi:hypothetical protein